MTPTQLMCARQKLRFRTQTELAEYLGVSRNAVTRWETGFTPVPQPVILVMQLLQQLEDEIAGCRCRR